MIEGFTERAGARLYHTVYGRGPAVLLLHDAALSAQSLNHRMMATLGDWLWQRRYQVVAFDMRGFGRSTHVAAFDPDYHQINADDADAVLADLGLDEVAVIGIGDGAVAGLNLAIRHPARVRAIIADSAAWTVTPATAIATPAFPAGPATNRCRELLDEMHGHDYVEPMLSACAALKDQLARDRANLYKDRLTEVRCPVLFLACENDRLELARQARELGAQVPDSRVVVVHERGDRVVWAAPARLRAAVEPFLEDHLAGVVA